jgi:pSer/pThr/pTyr-binding forkhead associated (FHA) protein
VEYDHATVVRTGEVWQIELSGAATDLRVNDEPVRGSRTLKPGDVIRIGPARLRFESVS